MSSLAARVVLREHGRLPEESRFNFTIRTITDLQVRDVVAHSERLIAKSGVQFADDLRVFPNPVVQYSLERRRLNAGLREYLCRSFYYNSDVSRPNTRAVRIPEKPFRFYLRHPAEMGA